MEEVDFRYQNVPLTAADDFATAPWLGLGLGLVLLSAIGT